MKRLIVTPLGWFVSFVRKWKADTFVNGLVFGAIFSLVVNVLTIQIQEAIQRQRVFEAVENEIAANARLAARQVEKHMPRITSGEMPNFFDIRPRYASTVWGTSEGQKYIVQMSGEIQGLLASYYDILIPRHNDLIDKYDALAEKYLSGCYFETDGLSQSEKDECISWHSLVLTGEVETARAVGKESFEILDSFHPTRDRLRNPFLRLLMGDTAIGQLAGE